MHDAFMEVLGRKRPMTSNEVANIWLQAREMHRQEIIDSNKCGFQDGILVPTNKPIMYQSAEHYYNETYGR